jgi:hypothetical protein
VEVCELTVQVWESTAEVCELTVEVWESTVEVCELTAEVCELTQTLPLIELMEKCGNLSSMLHLMQVNVGIALCKC